MTDKDKEIEISYADAIKELEGIVATLQGDKCDIDNMVTLTRRGAELLRICRQRLTTTEAELRDVLAQLQSPGE